MNILVLSFYFCPDLCACSFRTTSLCNALYRLVPTESKIDVVTTMPNRYNSFTEEASVYEERNGMSIFRVKLPVHQSGLLDQSKAFLVFFRKAIRCTVDKDYDIVFATSSRLMTATLGAWIAKQKDAKLYLDMRDIFVDTINDILPRKIFWPLITFFSLIEKWTISQADKVNLVSPGFFDYFANRYPDKNFSYFTNGIDDEFLAAVPDQLYLSDPKSSKGPVTVLYAGNIGEGQGLHNIIPKLAKRMQHFNFKIIGDGGRKHELKLVLKKKGITNVELLPPMKRNLLIQAYCDADVLFLHLNDYNAFKKVLPSKIFEYAALGKPIWAGVSGYAADFIRKEISNAAVFKPCDVDDAVQSLDKLNFQNIQRTVFVKKYMRANISENMVEDILSMTDNDC